MRCSESRAAGLLAELQRELPPGHKLSGAPLEAFADRDGVADDVLLRRLDQPDRFAIVHLTWRRRTEIDARWPSVEFEGTFDELVAYWGDEGLDD